MEIVINIDEETLQDLYDSRYVSPHIKDVFRSATPLPKGHGRLNVTNGDMIKALFPDAPRVHKFIQNNFYTWSRTDFRGDTDYKVESEE